MTRKSKAAAFPFEALAEFRYQIRRFLEFSEAAARDVGLEPRQHQCLLALRGLPPGQESTVGTLAERLRLRHHSTVELVNRLTRRGLVDRRTSERDRRAVLVTLTRRAESLLARLSESHVEELATVGPRLVTALERVLAGSRTKTLSKRT